MKKLEFFLKALAAHEYKRTAWVISAFSLIREKGEEWRAEPYPYRIVQSLLGMYFVNPEDPNALLEIEDAPIGQPIFQFKEKVSVPALAVANLTSPITTTYGNLLYNSICLVYPFGDKIPYQTGRIKTDKIEEMIVARLKDTPPPNAERDPKFIYVDEWRMHANATFALVAYTQLCVPACSYKSMTAPPGIKEYRQKLLDENKDRLYDPAVIAKIDAQLVEFLKDYLKDDPAMGFLITSKSFDVVRKRLFLMSGAEATLDDRIEVALVTRSLSEGWSMKDMPILNTASRSGSFNRGAQTELGGEAVKWLFRASSNLTITQKNCGSRMGNYFFAEKGEEHKLLGFTAIEGANDVLITQENIGAYLGKRTLLRSPMFCKLEKTDFCEACVGQRLAVSPTSLSLAVADYGNVFLSLFMKSMHSNILELAPMNYKEVFI